MGVGGYKIANQDKEKILKGAKVKEFLIKLKSRNIWRGSLGFQRRSRKGFKVGFTRKIEDFEGLERVLCWYRF